MSLVNTLMQPIRASYMGALDKNELRPSRYGAFQFFSDDTESPNGILNSDVREKIKNSFGNSIVIPVLDHKNVTIGNTRSCVIADDENQSQLMTLSFATYSFGFTMTPAQYRNNDIGYQQDFSRKLNSYLIQLGADLDTQSISVLETVKNTFWGGINSYTNVGDALQITQAEKNDYYNKLASIKETMDFYGDIKIIDSTSGGPMERRLSAQGDSNSINEAFQMTPYQWYRSNRILNGTGVESTHYACTEGSVAIESRIDPDALMGHRIGDVAEWGVVDVPLPGTNRSLQMGSFYRKDCSDASGLQGTPADPGIAGLTRSLKESFEWSADLVWVTAYNSDPANRYSPVLKGEISVA